MKVLGLFLVAITVTALAGCGEEFEGGEGYLEENAQALVIPPDAPCHVDIDRHFFYRTAEAYGDEETTVEGGNSRYRKVMMVSNNCSWNIPAHRCADEAWRAAWASTHGGRWQDAPPMPNAVYDHNTCQGTTGGDGGGDGDGRDLVFQTARF